MRQLALALVVAAGVTVACDEAPKNEYAAACLKIMRSENGGWIFGSGMAAVADPFCACIGEETGKTKKLDSGDKAKVLAYLNAFDPTDDFIKIGAKFGDFRRTMGDKFDGFKDVLTICQERLSK